MCNCITISLDKDRTIRAYEAYLRALLIYHESTFNLFNEDPDIPELQILRSAEIDVIEDTIQALKKS